jgi:hypothetical protein
MSSSDDVVINDATNPTIHAFDDVAIQSLSLTCREALVLMCSSFAAAGGISSICSAANSLILASGSLRVQSITIEDGDMQFGGGKAGYDVGLAAAVLPIHNGFQQHTLLNRHRCRTRPEILY